MADLLFQLEEACLSFAGRAVLRDITLSVATRENVCLLGASGSGKTTLLRSIGALQSLDSGYCSFAGEVLDLGVDSKARSIRSQIGFMHQDLALVPNLTAAQNVLAGRLGQVGFWKSVRSMLMTPSHELGEAYELLDSLGVGQRLFQRTDTLSGGEQQRVALARALYQQPLALLVDEPVSFIDPARGRVVLELLTGQARERGLTLVASLHDPGLAREHFDRIVGLRAGKVVLDVSAAELTEEQLELLYRLEGEDHEA